MSQLRVLLPVVMASALNGCGAAPPSNALSVVKADSSGFSVMTVRGSIDALPRWTIDSVPTFQVRGDEAPFLSDVGEIAVLVTRDALEVQQIGVYAVNRSSGR